MHNSLRLGNLIMDAKGQICRVERLQNSDPDEQKIEAWPIDGGALVTMPFKPIPLTEKILRQFDLVWRNGYGWDFAMGKILKHENGFFFHYNLLVVRLDYIHDLQNLYHSLTGTELEFKPSLASS